MSNLNEHFMTKKALITGILVKHAPHLFTLKIGIAVVNQLCALYSSRRSIIVQRPNLWNLALTG